MNDVQTKSTWKQTTPGTLALAGTIMTIVYRHEALMQFHIYQGDRNESGVLGTHSAGARLLA
jgi:hypothetical protein